MTQKQTYVTYFLTVKQEDRIESDRNHVCHKDILDAIPYLLYTLLAS